ncbi:hypothetical protein B0H21DRAFT_757532 [Amylocystis lapponica]|nr:hypothetical protein B0H21DRAFT_757532 [Amylocystis lapponica]
MAPKAHRTASGGLTRTHSRTSSGGASKLGLNLQITQKDIPPPRIPDKSKKNVHAHHEPAARTTSPYPPRVNSGIRVQSREHIQPALNRRAPAPSTNARANAAKQRVDFTISSPSEGDDDEWISSESGAATPCASVDSDAEEIKTPVEPSKPLTARVASHLNGLNGQDVQTPRAEPPSLPRIDTARPALPPAARDFVQEPPPQIERHDQRRPRTDPPPQPMPPITKAHSETHSPPRKSPDLTSTRQSMTRPPSTHSITSRSDAVPLRPHPLIRGHSYGHGAPFTPKPAHLAPLAVVSSDAAEAQMSMTPSPSSVRASSPTSIKTVSTSPNTSPQSSQAHKQLRRTSTSSARSTATLPAPPTPGHAHLSKSNHDRQRTLSTISASSSSFAALSNLALRSTPSPPRTPVQITSHFPTIEQGTLESIHPLLPPPYLNAHLTVLAYRNPIAESFDRVSRAKQHR